MTTQKTITPAQMTRLPDAPPKDPDEVSAFRHLYDRGLNDYLTFHFGNRETTPQSVRHSRFTIHCTIDKDTLFKR